MKVNSSLLRNNMKWSREWWVKRFYWFLFWHRSLNKYLRECGKSRRGTRNRFELLYKIVAGNVSGSRYFFPEDFVDSRFIFDNTEDGFEFWSDLDTKWKKSVLKTKESLRER